MVNLLKDKIKYHKMQSIFLTYLLKYKQMLKHYDT